MSSILSFVFLILQPPSVTAYHSLLKSLLTLEFIRIYITWMVDRRVLENISSSIIALVAPEGNQYSFNAFL